MIKFQSCKHNALPCFLVFLQEILWINIAIVKSCVNITISTRQRIRISHTWWITRSLVSLRSSKASSFESDMTKCLGHRLPSGFVLKPEILHSVALHSTMVAMLLIQSFQPMVIAIATKGQGHRFLWPLILNNYIYTHLFIAMLGSHVCDSGILTHDCCYGNSWSSP